MINIKWMVKGLSLKTENTWFATVIDLSRFKGSNKGHSYVIAIMNCITNQLYAVTIKKLTKVSNEFEYLIKDIKDISHVLIEKNDPLLNSKIINNLTRKGINCWIVSEDKLEMVRSNIEYILTNHWQKNKTMKYIKNLETLITDYNSDEISDNESIDSCNSNDSEKWIKKEYHQRNKFKKGHIVRLSRNCYSPRGNKLFSTKLYKIASKSGDRYILKELNTNKHVSRKPKIHNIQSVDQEIVDIYK